MLRSNKTAIFGLGVQLCSFVLLESSPIFHSAKKFMQCVHFLTASVKSYKSIATIYQDLHNCAEKPSSNKIQTNAK